MELELIMDRQTRRRIRAVGHELFLHPESRGKSLVHLNNEFHSWVAARARLSFLVGSFPGSHLWQVYVFGSRELQFNEDIEDYVLTPVSHLDVRADLLGKYKKLNIEGGGAEWAQREGKNLKN